MPGQYNEILQSGDEIPHRRLLDTTVKKWLLFNLFIRVFIQINVHHLAVKKCPLIFFQNLVQVFQTLRKKLIFILKVELIAWEQL